MTREEGLAYIANGFQEVADGPRLGSNGGWREAENGENFQALFKGLVDRYKLTPDHAVSILEAAFTTTAAEYGV